MRHLYPLLCLIAGPLAGQVQTIVPAFDTVTVEYDFYEPPYVHRATALDTGREGYERSLSGNWLSFSGHDRDARTVMDQSRFRPAMDTARYERFRDSFQAVPAVKSLLTDAERHEIMIVNEAHHEPRHRVFARQLLRGLYARGYRHLGVETLLPGPVGDSLLRTMPYPTLGSGYYTRDPQFAAMVHEARVIGFRLFGYEADHEAGDGPRERETKQMQNIVAYRGRHPEGKLLLYVGYSHATEGELGGQWDRAMAQRLADTTGLDPLTVNQTDFRELGYPKQEAYEYRLADPELPVVFTDAAGTAWGFGDGIHWFDRYVFHPRSTYRYGRPDYVYTFGRRPVLLDLSNVGVAGPYLIQAYRTGDDITSAVPRDVVEMKAPEERALALSPGDYTLLLTTPDREQYIARVMVR